MNIEFPEPRIVHANGIRLAVHEAGRGRPVVLLHGFPELAYSWRHQLPALAAAGYRAIAPDLRGYGRSDKPDAVDDYRMACLLGDVTGLLDALQLEQALFVGHDWGALVLWQLALAHPERMQGLIILNIPYLPRSDEEPIARMREKYGNRFYIVNFQDSSDADRRFAEDPAHFISVMMRKDVITRAQFEALPPHRKVVNLLATMAKTTARGRALLTPAELRYYAAAFAAGGFSGPINYYRNWSANWAAAQHLPRTVHVPTLFIGAADDVIVTPGQVEAMRPHVSRLEMQVFNNCGHWTQQEQPERTNAVMLDWLSRHYPAEAP